MTRWYQEKSEIRGFPGDQWADKLLLNKALSHRSISEGCYLRTHCYTPLQRADGDSVCVRLIWHNLCLSHYHSLFLFLPLLLLLIHASLQVGPVLSCAHYHVHFSCQSDVQRSSSALFSEAVIDCFSWTNGFSFISSSDWFDKHNVPFLSVELFLFLCCQRVH